MPTPPPLPPRAAYPTLDYRAQPSLFRDGNQVVAVDGTTLPALCIKCGSKDDLHQQRCRMYWHEPWLYVLIIISLPVYAIVALIVRKRATVHVFVCRRHRNSRRTGLAIGILAMVLSVVGFAVGVAKGFSDLAIFSGLVFIVGVILIAIYQQIVRPGRIIPPYVWIKGADEELLRTLPSQTW
jgi:hypothetical protein